MQQPRPPEPRVAPATAGLWRATQFPEDTYAGYGGAFYAIPRRSDPARKALAGHGQGV